MGILASIGQWLLKIFLGGLYGKVISQADDEARHKVDAAVVQAQTANDAAKVEVEIIKDQSEIKDHYAEKPENPADPFDNADWNEVKKS